MEMRRLRHFLAVAEYGTLTAAATHLGVAQPAVSQSISRLEAEVGARLFERTRRGAQLTPAGIAFREDVIDGVGLLEGAIERARERAKGKAGRLTVGTVTGGLYVLLPQAMTLMRQHFPRIQIVIKEMGNLEQAEALRANTIDVGFMHPPFPSSPWLKEKVLREDKLMAVVPRDFPAPRASKINFRNLCSYDLITFREDLMPGLRADLRAAYRAAGFPLRIGQEVGHTMTALSCVSAGAGIALLPVQVSNIRFRDVRYLEIRDADSLPRSVTSVVWRASGKSTLADRFVELLDQAG
ncbi:LysR family transcriptional regulator [Bordetella sp. LUAb4]|uniref:LysR family transcriptional regulator n=1 Tax=Bordetella sp. LUAb4 TaxID=2843195 RepID=UPI00351D0A26